MKVKINELLCKGCNICVHVCPKGTYAKGNRLSDMGYFAPLIAAPEKCFNHNRDSSKLICELCVLSCPDQAITWVPEE